MPKENPLNAARLSVEKFALKIFKGADQVNPSLVDSGINHKVRTSRSSIELIFTAKTPRGKVRK